MRRFKEDIKDISAWKRCGRRPDKFYVTYSTTGAVYHNPHDSSNTVARYKTPILIRDSTEAYWTESVRNLCSSYEQVNGAPIDEEFLDLIRTGEFYEIRPKTDVVYWAFHASLKEYGWDCPYGANKLNRPHGDGDYLVCRGENKPDFETVEVVHNAMFTRLYNTKEG